MTALQMSRVGTYFAQVRFYKPHKNAMERTKEPISIHANFLAVFKKLRANAQTIPR